MKNPKQKGNSFENEICKKLSLWASNGQRNDAFSRTTTSGAQATIANRFTVKNKTLLGDICGVDNLGNQLTNVAVIECKHRKNPRWDSLIYPLKNENIASFWLKIKHEGNSVNKCPLLIIRQNYKDVLILIDEGAVHVLKNYINLKILAIYPSPYNFRLYNFENFLKEVDYVNFCHSLQQFYSK